MLEMAACASFCVLISTKAIGTPAMAIASAGYQFSCAAAQGGLGYCWGRGDEGQLGTGLVRDNVVPLAISGVSGPAGPDVVGFSRLSTGGLAYACGLSTSNGVYCWGDGSKGQLGSAQELSSLLPVRVSVQ